MTFSPPIPNQEEERIWVEAYHAALEFWNSILNENRISIDFKKIATYCYEKLQKIGKNKDALFKIG